MFKLQVFVVCVMGVRFCLFCVISSDCRLFILSVRSCNSSAFCWSSVSSEVSKYAFVVKLMFVYHKKRTLEMFSI